ncbi:MAG: hypothetical protein JO013_01255 [Alphaproteobacteria bacterium]|nr:hypothetical protein [Alphaproteobacteria bacterium]
MTDMSTPPADGRPAPGAPGGTPAEPPPDDARVPTPAYPWDADPPPEEEFGPDGRRVRHDAFTARRRHDFLRALVKAGCLADACRAVGVAPATVYRHQNEDAGFAAQCRAAIEMAAVPVEIAAWQRAVEGVDQQFACGGEVHVRRRYSDGLLRLLLQGSNPKKYGPNPGFKRRRLLRHERKAMEREIRAEIEAEQEASRWTFDEAIAALEPRLAVLTARDDAEKLAAGWTRTPEGDWVPPGYGPIAGWPAADRAGRAAPPASPAVAARDVAGGDGMAAAGPTEEGETPRETV